MKPWAYVVIAVIGVFFLLISIFWLFLRPRGGEGLKKTFEISEGEGFRSITNRLEKEEVIRSSRSFQVYGFMKAEAKLLKPGVYRISTSSSSPAILRQLVLGIDREVKVTIPEGSSIFDIDEILSEAGVLKKGELKNTVLQRDLEGRLFPDTYRFYFNSSVENVLSKFEANFEARMASVLPEDKKEANDLLIMASILEKEVPTVEDQKIVAGLLLKRMDIDMALQVDASVCYAKRLENGGKGCYPVTVLDTQRETPYNTYRYRGLPPGPIGNPGISAVLAAASPISSPYWYYLSDPVTKKTIFSKTLEEHEENRFNYLLSPTH